MPCPRVIPLLLLAACGLACAMEPDQRAAAKAELATVSAEARRLSRAFELIHEIVGASVLTLRTSRNEDVLVQQGHRWFLATQEVAVGEGSGFIFASDDKGSHVLTNAHVVLQTEDKRPAPFDRVTVVLNDNRQIGAEYVGYDLATDLAVMRIPVPNLPTIDWADSDRAKVGDWVVALGYPLGVGYSATAGIISATDRSTGIYESIGGFESFIQTDASINRGNSGGPLVTLEGEVVGVNASIISPTGSSIGLGFAIPSALARRVGEDIVEHGRVIRPQIGVYLENLDPDRAQAIGLPPRQAVKVVDLIPGGPAERAGVQRDDVLVAVDGVRIASRQHFRARVAGLRVGGEFGLTVWRGGKEIALPVTPVAEDDLEDAARKAAEKGKGIRLRGFGMTVGLDDKPGLVVLAIDRGESADLAGLAAGDRLLLEREYGELDDLEDAKALAARRELVLQAVQRGRSVWIGLKR